ncbi:MAG: helix-turn-helix domain-containing protein [Nitrospinaceae bacterium]|nr:helix-turn-helix domain-containing protein [Nitrospinaceae bacterium]NIR46847.1 helix-turn-helix domain-containing protein [candidate division KSB1 bacterium]NIS22458.1 helix-turn-helix domain-containing protein [candidate division KSB1 bacterium]NIT80384.1 helix-turn-helix domain-containing protein [Nitrospinaceae bacterium]NIU22965.1 helix-turn-helix domain-containing protein [candidate division KSB1 bacterium]
MGKRYPNPQRVKIHRNYTVEEVADLLGVHKNTVRQWIKRGLPVIEDQRPMLILGPDLAAFLQAQRVKNKKKCKPGEMYCFRCRAPKSPALDMAEYQPKTEFLGNLFGICPDCGGGMNRNVNPAKLEQIRAKLEITFPEAVRRIVDCEQPPVNSDFK